MRITRIIILLFIIFLLIKPRWVFKKQISPFSVVILDDSPSMKMWKTLPDFRNIIASLSGKHYILKVSRFSKKNTYLGTAIEYTGEHFPDASSIILLSDGINSGGDDPVDAADKLQIPIFSYAFKDSFKDNFIKSVYGEPNIFEGETLHIQVETEGGDSIVLKGKKRWIKKITGGKTIFDVVPDTGSNLYQIYLYPMDSLSENNRAVFSCNVTRKKRIYIISNEPSLDFKYIGWMFKRRENLIERFIRRGKGFFLLDSLRYKMPDIKNADIIVAVNPDNKIENLVKEGLGIGKNVIYFPAKLFYAPYLPFLPGASKPEQLFIVDTLPPIAYLNPSGLLPEAKAILSIDGKPLFAEMKYHRGNIIESSFKGLWRLGLREGIEFLKEKFNAVDSNITSIHLIYPYILNAGEDMEITVVGGYSSGWIEFEGKKFALRKFMGDTLKAIIFPPVEKGKYSFKVFLQNRFYGAYQFHIMDISEEFRLNHPDTVLLASVANVSGGRFIHNIKEIPKFKAKEKEIYFDAIHNPFLLGFLILLLGIDWYLWKRNRIKNSGDRI